MTARKTFKRASAERRESSWHRKAGRQRQGFPGWGLQESTRNNRGLQRDFPLERTGEPREQKSQWKGLREPLAVSNPWNFKDVPLQHPEVSSAQQGSGNWDGLHFLLGSCASRHTLASAQTRGFSALLRWMGWAFYSAGNDVWQESFEVRPSKANEKIYYSANSLGQRTWLLGSLYSWVLASRKTRWRADSAACSPRAEQEDTHKIPQKNENTRQTQRSV